MKKILSIIATAIIPMVLVVSCKKSSFEDAYKDPSKVSTSTVEKQFSGMLFSNREYVIPSYWNYFVILKNTALHYTQAVGWANSPGQYVPGGAAITDRWNNYYTMLAQYRELQKINGALTAAEQAEKRIFMIAAAIYFYDQTQKVVDLHGDIPWSQAGMLSANGGNYSSSLAKYDTAESIYTTMLDELKAFADELNTLTVPAATAKAFTTQDLINNGDVTLWKRYCNSLRLRMLTRVSGAGAFQARSSQEIGTIVGDATKYPVVNSNDVNIKWDIYNVGSDINSKGFRTGLEDWNGNIAPKVMIDRMKSTADPRLRAIFEPGANANGVYNGLDQSLNETAQTNLINGGTVAIYNRSTFSRNEFFPGMLIDAAEVSFLISEYYTKSGSDSQAKTAYENGINQSIDFFYWVRTVTNDQTAPALTPTNPTQKAAYISNATVSWTTATTPGAKIDRIATEKWLHFNVVQPLESWAEIRRLNAPALAFPTDGSSNQQQPPVRWIYPAGELAYNTENYQAVKGKDNLQTKLFWDVN
jgi:hypothetical protein